MSYMTPKTVYLAGGMGGLTLDEAEGWRLKIKEIFQDIAPKISFVNPVDHCWFDKVEFGLMTEKEAMEVDLYKLSKSDFMIVNFNAPHSIGTNIEIGYATAKQIPILGLNESGNKLHSWQTNLVHKMFTRMEDLIAYFVDHFLYDE